MRGLDIAISALYMRGFDPTEDHIIKEVVRMSKLEYKKGEEGTIKKAFDALSSWSPYESIAKFMARDFNQGYGWCARFREGDLVENAKGSWKYGIVKGIVTQWNSGVEPNCFSLEVSIKNGKTDKVFWQRLKEGDVKLANLPPEIMELARSQVVSKCPLMNGECE